MYLKRLKDLRIDNDKSQREIAEILNMKQPQYARYELGLVEIPLSYAIILTDYYNVSLDYITERTDNTIIN